jgi:hypothetical protein
MDDTFDPLATGPPKNSFTQLAHFPRDVVRFAANFRRDEKSQWLAAAGVRTIVPVQ